jgi:hypothetical protein
MATPIKLTVQGIAKAACPPGKAEVKLPIEGQRGAYLRLRGANKTVQMPYRDATGKQRWFKVCDASTTSPKNIADAISIVRGRLAKGGDPAGEKKAEAKRERARLEPALDAYEADLERRKVVKRGEVMSLLRREMLGPLGNIELPPLTRNDFVKRIREVEVGGRPGTAKELKTRACVFLSWCVDQGLITASPLAGWRRPRKTRAERIERPGRALADWELPALWKAAGAQGAIRGLSTDASPARPEAHGNRAHGMVRPRPRAGRMDRAAGRYEIRAAAQDPLAGAGRCDPTHAQAGGEI